MHRALLLPEIVTAIVGAGKIEPGLLHSCLLVNKLFFHETCRILWKGCYGIFGVGYVTPVIGHLGSMVSNPNIGPQRAQCYANFIRVLVFQEEEGSDLSEDALWHPRLRQLQFPLLEDLSIWKTRSAEQLNTESAILHYVHSGLRDLRVDTSGPLSDLFLDEVSRLCPRLQQLDVDFQNVTISKEGLARFLGRMLYLEGVHVAALDKSWSAEAFVAVAKYKRLKLLHVPAVCNTWLDDLEATSLFPVLKQFYALNTTGKTLLWLHSANPCLEAIHLYNRSLLGKEDVLSAASNFHELRNFKYQPSHNMVIAGQDLVKLARGCPCLTYMDVGQEEDVNYQIDDFNDSVVCSIAQSLPSLVELYLLGSSDSYPSIAAIFSAFNQYCPLLKRLEISCGHDWNTFASPHQWSFPHLWTINLDAKVHLASTLSEQECSSLLSWFTTFAPLWFPKLEYFNITDADDLEQELSDYMYEVGSTREYGSGADGIKDEEELVEERNNVDLSSGNMTERTGTIDSASN